MDGPVVSTASDLVRLRADDDGRGLLFEGGEWSWREVVAGAAARAALFEQLRLPGPFHIGVLLENTPEYLACLMAAALAGATIVGINPTRRGAELATDIRHTDCQLIVTDSTQTHHLDGIDPHDDLGLEPRGTAGGRILAADSPGFAELVAAHEGAALPDHRPAPEDLYLLIFTSGSTGAPKAVRFSQGRAAKSAVRVPFSPDDVLYSAMPLFHGNALNSIVFPAWYTGATIALRRRFSASSFLPDVREVGATFVSTVGRAIAHIVATEPSDLDRDHRLQYVLGPETSEADKASFTERYGVPLFEGYGSSENAIILQPAPSSKRSALGLASERDDVVVLDPDTSEERPRARFDELGQLVNGDEAIGELVGRNVLRNFEGYYNNPEAEAERGRAGWYWSGDLAYRDDDGVFYFAGRVGDWLRVDSENFAAAPVERVLSRFGPARGVAVYPVPDSRTGDQVMAAIELRAGTGFDPAEFVAFLEDQLDLGTKWAPRYVRIVDALPLTGTNKLNKQPLKTARWDTTDPLWHRPGRDLVYVPMTVSDRAALEADFEANGRGNLLT
jgi:fatty-acyl-CoA synthase